MNESKETGKENVTEKLKVHKSTYLDLKKLKSSSLSEIEESIFILSSTERVSILLILTVTHFLCIRNPGGVHYLKLCHFITEFSNVRAPNELFHTIMRLSFSGLIFIKENEKDNCLSLVSLSNEKIGKFAYHEFLKESPQFKEFINYLSNFDINKQVEMEIISEDEEQEQDKIVH